MADPRSPLVIWKMTMDRDGWPQRLQQCQNRATCEVLKKNSKGQSMPNTARIRKLSLLTGLVLVSACGQDGTRKTSPEAEVGSAGATADPVRSDITVAGLREMMSQRDFVLVNVHIPFEGDIPGTDETIPFDEISEHLDQLPVGKDSKIILYCRSGRMSAEAADALANLGYTNVFNLLGGFRAWEAAGYELEGVGGP